MAGARGAKEASEALTQILTFLGQSASKNLGEISNTSVSDGERKNW